MGRTKLGKTILNEWVQDVEIPVNDPLSIINYRKQLKRWFKYIYGAYITGNVPEHQASFITLTFNPKLVPVHLRLSSFIAWSKKVYYPYLFVRQDYQDNDETKHMHFHGILPRNMDTSKLLKEWNDTYGKVHIEDPIDNIDSVIEYIFADNTILNPNYIFIDGEIDHFKKLRPRIEKAIQGNLI